ncbi:hypothetical protein HOY82DRAFT_600260 [Tuber indicum]|nr:hypothetical protein HOY82DRAFT_600260 [Tuber indicum]
MKACPNIPRPTYTSSFKSENAAPQIPISSLNPRTPEPRPALPILVRIGSPALSPAAQGVYRLNLRENEHEELLGALGSTPTTLTLLNAEVNRADEVNILELAEASRAEEERRPRTAGFELRARNMGITGMKLVAEKVAIWEGMWAAQQAGNDI